MNRRGGAAIAASLLSVAWRALQRTPDESILDGPIMIVRYVRDADVLLLELRDESPIDAVEEHGGIVISYGDKGLFVSVEFLNPS